MFISITLFIALQFFVGHSNYDYPRINPAPKSVTVKDLFHKLSTSDAALLFGREHLLDSSASLLTDPRIKWHEHFLDSVLGRHNTIPATYTQMVFAPVNFEGVNAKVTILFGVDSSFGATVSIPYPVRLHAQLTPEDFHSVGKSISKSLGEPSVSTQNYIDYFVNGNQSLIGSLKDGVITINLWRLGP